MTKTKRIEEIRENNRDELIRSFEDPKFRSVAAKVYLKLIDIWELEDHDAERLIGAERGALHGWRSSDLQSLDEEAFEKISYLIGIYRVLYQIYEGSGQLVARWMVTMRNDEVCEGLTPFEYLLDQGVFGFVRLREHANNTLERVEKL